MIMDYGTQGRVAPSKGLGKACAMGLAREGARLAICARGDDGLKRTAREIMVTTVVTLSKPLSNQCAKDNVLINTFCPGLILTDCVALVVGSLART
jgi:3-oxoacyl-[acyl-carrier protein] reductase